MNQNGDRSGTGFPADEREAPWGLELTHVSKQLGNVAAVRDLTLRVEQGEFFTLLGPSGCGKSTTLNLVAGFVAPDEGIVRIAGESVSSIAPEHRNVGMVFQSYALFAHLSVGENVAFPLRRRKIAKPDVARRVHEVLRLVEMDDRIDAKPSELSGGQQQRVALARALVYEPRVVLLDEPLGALDRRLRQHLQEQLRALHEQLGFTALYVTHDQEEGLALSDRVGIMLDGRLEQVGTGREMYERPKNLFVANFLGDANSLDGVVERCADDTCAVRLAATDALLELHRAPGASVNQGDPVTVVARPEALQIAPVGTSDQGESPMRGTLMARTFLGEDVVSRVRVFQDQELLVSERADAVDSRCQVGEEVGVRWRSRQTAVAVPKDDSVAGGAGAAGHAPVELDAS